MMQTPRLWPSACGMIDLIEIPSGKAREAEQATKMRTRISSGPVAESRLRCEHGKDLSHPDRKNQSVPQDGVEDIKKKSSQLEWSSEENVRIRTGDVRQR
eukprot:8231151-Pyramimonas_sp.AAC.1